MLIGRDVGKLRKTQGATLFKVLGKVADPQTVTLLTLDYMGSQFSMSPTHLPILIHDPHQLIGKLPGAENMSPAEHKDQPAFQEPKPHSRECGQTQECGST